MIIKAENPALLQEQTWLRQDHSSGVSVLYVQRAVVFDSNHLQLHEYGIEQAEINRISATRENEKEIVLNGTTKYFHASNTPVFEQPYNQIRFWKASAVDTTYGVEITSAITPDKPYTEFNFPTGTSTDYGKFQPYDSVAASGGTIGAAFQLVVLTRTTAKDIIDGAMIYAGARNSRKWSSDDWRRALSDALVQMTDEVRMRTSYTSASFSANGSATQTLPTDFLEEDVLKLGNSPYQIVPLRDFRAASSNSRRAAIDGSNLLMGDSPSSSEALVLYYYALHPAIATNSEEVDVAKRCILALKYFLAAHYKLANQEDPSYLFKLYDTEIQRLKDKNPNTLPQSFGFIGSRRGSRNLDDPLNLL